MNILQINTNDLRGGAAKVMDRLIVAQNKLGDYSNAIVGKKETTNKYTYPFDKLIDRDVAKYTKLHGILDYEYNGVFKLVDNPLFKEADVIHLHNIHGSYFNPYALSYLSHIKPVVWTLHDMQSVTGHCAYSYHCERWKDGCGSCPNLIEYPSIEVDRTANNFLEKKEIYSKSKLYIVPVANWIKNIANEGILLGQRMQTILNGVDCYTYRPLDKEGLKRKYGIPNNKVIIGVVANGGGTSYERKGGKYVEAVIERLINEGINVLLINVGGESKGYTNNYTFNTGYISSENEMSEIYNLFDIYLFPSIADTCPLVILEAMACGVPVITFNTGGIPELVQHNSNGFVAKQNDLNELYMYTLELVNNDCLRKKFSENSRNYAQKFFAHELIVQKYYSVYKEAINYFYENQKKVLYFNSLTLPEIIKNSVYFQKSEKIKGRKSENNIVNLNNNSKVYIISDSNFEHGYASGFLYTDINDDDIVYVKRRGYELSEKFFETMLYKGMNTEVLTSKINVKNEDNTRFFSSISSVLNSSTKMINSSYGGIFYKGDIFRKNREQILNGEIIKINSIEEYDTELIEVRIITFIQNLIKEKIYIYGAGTHTEVLLEQCPGLSGYIEAIVDKNTKLQGNFFLNMYPIISLSEVRESYPVLISSATFESEIYEELSGRLKNSILTIYNKKG